MVCVMRHEFASNIQEVTIDANGAARPYLPSARAYMAPVMAIAPKQQYVMYHVQPAE